MQVPSAVTIGYKFLLVGLANNWLSCDRLRSRDWTEVNRPPIKICTNSECLSPVDKLVFFVRFDIWTHSTKDFYVCKKSKDFQDSLRLRWLTNYSKLLVVTSLAMKGWDKNHAEQKNLFVAIDWFHFWMSFAVLWSSASSVCSRWMLENKNGSCFIER